MTDTDRQASPKLDQAAACADCGLPYDDPGWADVVVPNAIWREISPTRRAGGLLCFNCINARLSALGYTNVPFRITSGPFAFMVREVEDQMRKEAELERLQKRGSYESNSRQT